MFNGYHFDKCFYLFLSFRPIIFMESENYRYILYNNNKHCENQMQYSVLWCWCLICLFVCFVYFSTCFCATQVHNFAFESFPVCLFTHLPLFVSAQPIKIHLLEALERQVFKGKKNNNHQIGSTADVFDFSLSVKYFLKLLRGDNQWSQWIIPRIFNC